MPAHDSLQFAHELRLEQAPHSLLLKRVMDAGLPFIRMDAWATSATSLEAVGEAELRFSTEAGDRPLTGFGG